MRNIASLLLAALLAASCSGASPLGPAPDGGDAAVDGDGNGDVNGNGNGDGDGSTACDPSLTYASFGMAFFATYCNRCHDWDQQSAQVSGGAIVGAAGTGTFMPPTDPLPSPQQRAQLTAWITCGAP